ncbi:MAG: glycine--tRNA ligase subunit beta, partial [Holosporales bacterium]|nr:glycine--tRNA ligase subunit beta [Holosporales bacterium]
MTKTLFFEILSEEIPAKMQKNAIERAKEAIARILANRNVHHGLVYASCAPRRLCVCVKDVDEATQASVINKRGPRVNAPESALQGFLKGNNVTREDLIIQGEYFFAQVVEPAVKFLDTIPDVVGSFIKTMSWPKSMHWTIVCDAEGGGKEGAKECGENRITGNCTEGEECGRGEDSAGNEKRLVNSLPWVRPVRAVLCLWGNDVITFNIPEWGLTTGGVTYLSGCAVNIDSFEHYVRVLKENFVIVDYYARQEAVIAECEKAIQSQSTQHGTHVADDELAHAAADYKLANVTPKELATAQSTDTQEGQTHQPLNVHKSQKLTIKQDQALLDEITGLVDFPFIVIGKIDDAFMYLPPDVLSTSMKVHQKYLSVEESAAPPPLPSGAPSAAPNVSDVLSSPLSLNEKAPNVLAPYFIAVSNKPGNETTRRGFENVLRARLTDASFFYNEDLKTPMDANLPKLGNIVFHEKLGTLGEKVARLRRLVPEADRAATLCKLDLVSNMVGEFDELQGIIGAHYALKQGESSEVAQSIADHYTGHGNTLPITETGAKLALADKVDSLVGFFGIGVKPTGSKDPYALRRAALGIIRISLKRLQINLGDMVLAALDNYSTFIRIDVNSVFQSVVTFIYERFDVCLREQESLRYDVVQSVLMFGLQLCQKCDEPGHSSNMSSEKRSGPDKPSSSVSNAILNLRDMYIKAKSIQTYFESSSQDFMQLYTRVRGLIGEKNAKNTGGLDAVSNDYICNNEANRRLNTDETLFECPEEKEAYAALRLCEETLSGHANPQSGKAPSNRVTSPSLYEYCDYIKSMSAIASLKGVFDNMFSAVQINCEDRAIRANRLTLLLRVMHL